MLVVIDQFSKWVECYAHSDQMAKRVAGILVSEFIGRFGFPLELHTCLLQVCQLGELIITKPVSHPIFWCYGEKCYSLLT